MVHLYRCVLMSSSFRFSIFPLLSPPPQPHPPPFPCTSSLSDSVLQIFDQIRSADLDLDSAPWPLVSEEAKQLLRSLLDKDPAKRPTPADILGTWIKSVRLSAEFTGPHTWRRPVGGFRFHPITTDLYEIQRGVLVHLKCSIVRS